MSINFPTSLDSLTNPAPGDVVASALIGKLADAVEALEAKVGVDSSAVTTSLDYKVAHVSTGVDYGSVPASANGFKAWNYDPQFLVSSTNTLTLGTMYVMKLYAGQALTLTKGWVRNASNAVTPTHFYGALYSSAGALLAQSSDSVSQLGSGGPKFFTFSSTAVSAGVFYFGFWLTAAGSMDMAALNDLNGYGNTNLAAGSYRFSTADTGLSTTAPSTIGTMTSAVKPIWCAVS